MSEQRNKQAPAERHGPLQAPANTAMRPADYQTRGNAQDCRQRNEKPVNRSTS